MKSLADIAEGEVLTGGILSYTKNEIITLRQENERLRMLLWLRHGCSALYGDDGEMQCGHCRIDFKRDTAESMEQKWYVAGYEALKG